MTKRLVDRAQAWHGLAHAEPTLVPHPHNQLQELPDPARRFLQHALPTEDITAGSVVLDMEGEIKLQRWMPFRAHQILHPELGFVWNATVGRLPLRFAGGDSYWQHHGSLEFRLLGLIPVVRAASHDINRSAAGRLAAETAVWAPFALHPAVGANWQAIDEHSATVTRIVGGEPIDITLIIDAGGQLQELVMQRWGNPDSAEFDLHPFGATITDTGVYAGVTIAAAGTVGWYHGTDRQSEGEFFRFQITGAQPP